MDVHTTRGAECSPMRPHLAASSSSSSFTNCRGTCSERTLSAICSRIRRWLPSVVGNRYMRQMAPPNTEVRTQEDRLWVSPMASFHGCRPICMAPPTQALRDPQALFFPKKANKKANSNNKKQKLLKPSPAKYLYLALVPVRRQK